MDSPEKLFSGPSTPLSSRVSSMTRVSSGSGLLNVTPTFRNKQPAVTRSWMMTPRQAVKILAAAFCTLGVLWIFSGISPQIRHLDKALISSYWNASFLPNAALQPPEPSDLRIPDTTDTFSSYKYRNTCNISSLDLHAPFSPLCDNRQSMLEAMSSGGRIGFDAPYIPRGCDMRWFSTEEVCEILSRFEKVIIIGDSMMRHVIGSINVLIRKDLGYGAVTDWNFSPQERQDCFCNYQFNVKACSIQGIFKSQDVIRHDPGSLACTEGTFDLMIEQMIRFPIPPEETDRLKDLMGPKKPQKPFAFIFGHGLWNDLDLQATLDWLDLVLDIIGSHHSYLTKKGAFWPRLFITPNAAGVHKPDQWLVTQGNKALQLFEESVKVEAGRRGVEHVGTWNMSIQSNKFDGVHVDLKGNLIKAMMVMNWLNMLDVKQH
ncbi:MAG: hypothetical protein M1814_005640 [Vezdaea aestivalis]|nr:MAG: hypothetical protein M1814_005640 [Vezdaea aestivalis]